MGVKDTIYTVYTGALVGVKKGGHEPHFLLMIFIIIDKPKNYLFFSIIKKLP